MDWFRTHVYIAAWASPLITLIGFLVRNTLRPSEKMDWSMIIIYVTFLTCLAAQLTPGIEPAVRTSAVTGSTISFGLIIADSFFRH